MKKILKTNIVRLITLNLGKIEFAMNLVSWNIVYMKNLSRWAYMKDLISKGELAFYLNTKYNLSFKFSLFGYGSGGAIAIRFASLYPEFINSIFLDSPVVDFISCPLKIHDSYSLKSYEKEFKIIYPNEDIVSLETSSINPKNSLSILSEYEIPIYMIYSLDDDVVPFNENGILIDNAYQNKDVLVINRKSKPGHSSFGEISLVDEIKDFIIKHSLWEA